MENIQLNQGDIVTLSNNKEYIIFATAISNSNKNYIYLMTTKEPIEICFAEQTIVDGKLDLRILSNQNEKLEALNLFKISYARDQVEKALN